MLPLIWFDYERDTLICIPFLFEYKMYTACSIFLQKL